MEPVAGASASPRVRLVDIEEPKGLDYGSGTNTEIEQPDSLLDILESRGMKRVLLAHTAFSPDKLYQFLLKAQGTQLSTVMFSVETLKEVLSLAQKNDEPGVVRYCLNGLVNCFAETSADVDRRKRRQPPLPVVLSALKKYSDCAEVQHEGIWCLANMFSRDIVYTSPGAQVRMQQMLLRHSSRGKSLGMALLQELIETIVGALRTQHTARMRCVGTWTLLKLFTCTIGTAFKHQLSRDAVLLFVQKGGLACLLDVMAAWPKDLVLQRNGCCLLHVTAKQIDMHRIARTSELERLLVRVVCRCQESTNTFPRDKAVLHHGNCVVRCLSAFKGSLRCPDWAWKTSLRAGAHVDAQDEEELAWFEAVVVETQWVTPGGVDESKDCLAGTAASSANSVFMVKVHFLGWEEKWDQWINVTEHPDRIQRRNFMIASWRPLLRQGHMVEVKIAERRLHRNMHGELFLDRATCCCEPSAVGKWYEGCIKRIVVADASHGRFAGRLRALVTTTNMQPQQLTQWVDIYGNNISKPGTHRRRHISRIIWSFVKGPRTPYALAFNDN